MVTNTTYQNSDLPFNIIDIPQRSEAWHAFRIGKIGASQVAAIMGISPWTTKLQVWEEIAFGTKKKSNFNMERGVRLEAEALSWFNKFKGNKGPFFEPIVCQCKEYPKLLASLDGWNGITLVEIKCPRMFSGKVPEYYFCQMQHQLFVTGSCLCFYVEYVDGEGIIKEVWRDEKYIKDMLCQELVFLDSIVNFQPPKPVDADWVEIFDPEHSVKAERYKQLSLLIDELEIEREDIKQYFVGSLDHPRNLIGDLKVQKILRQGNVDYDKILRDYSITNKDEYRKKEIETWRITI